MGKRLRWIFGLACALSGALLWGQSQNAKYFVPVVDEAQPEERRPGRSKKDEPGAAMDFYMAKRAMDGVRAVPFDRYLLAEELVRKMRHYDVAAGRFSVGRKNAQERQLARGRWQELGPFNIGGRARAMVFDPRNADVMYVGAAAGGVYKTTDGGQSWKPMGDMLPNMAVNALAIDPKNGDVLYAGTGEGYNNIDAVRGNGIFKSTNGGESWTALATTRDNPAFFFVNDLVISPHDSNRLYAATSLGLYRSRDGGESWQQVLDRTTPHDGCSDLEWRPGAETDYLYAACGRRSTPATIFRQKAAEGDGEWEALLSEANMGRSVIAVAPSQPDMVYVLTSSNETGVWRDGLYAVFRSTAAGDKDSWEKRVTNQSPVRMNTALLTNQSGFFSDICSGGTQRVLSQGWYDIALTVDPVNPERVWAGGIDLFRSDDGGANWGLVSDWFFSPGDPTYVHADQHLIRFHPQYNGSTNKTVFFLNDGGMAKTDDALAPVLSNDDYCTGLSGFRHQDLVKGMVTTQFYHGLPYPGGHAWFGGKQDNGTSRGSRGAGLDRWREIFGGDGGYVAVAPDDPNRVYLETTRLSIRRATNGVTFSPITNGISEPSGNFLFITPFRMDPNDSQRLYIGGRTLWRTNNGGTNWAAFSPAIPTGNISAIAAAPGNPDRVVFGTTTGRLYRTNRAQADDVVESWAQNFVRINGYVSWLEFDPTNPDVLWATVSTFNNVSGEGHVFRSEDGGANWERRDAGIPDVPAHSVVVDPARPEHVYVGTDLGIFVSTDAGATWAKEDSGFVNTVVESMTIVRENGASTLTAFTHGRGVWQVNLDGDAAACTFRTTPLVRLTAYGGTPRLALETGEDCVWSVIPESSFARGTPAVGKGPREVPLVVNVNVDTMPRQTRVQIADQNVTIEQSGATGVSGNATAASAHPVMQFPFVGVANSRLSPPGAPEEAPVHSCTESRDSRHVWFRATPDFSGQVLVSSALLSAANALQAQVLTIYEGEAAAANERFCQRVTGQPAIRLNVEAGKTYLVQISAAGSNGAGGNAVLITGRVE